MLDIIAQLSPESSLVKVIIRPSWAGFCVSGMSVEHCFDSAVLGVSEIWEVFCVHISEQNFQIPKR